jgi:hypothetical protein
LTNSRGALELSVKAIVILIIALVVVGLVIGFSVVKFTDVGNRLVFDAPTPEPDSYDPIQTPGGKQQFVFGKADKIEMGLKLYNSLTDAYESDWTNASIINCVGDSGTVTFYPDIPFTVIDAGEDGDVAALFDVEPSVQPGRYACEITFKTRSKYVVPNPGDDPVFVQGEPIANKYVEVDVK